MLRRIDLLQEAVLHHRDAGRHGHGLDLVVGHVDEGGAQALVQLADFSAGLHAQFGVQVRERLVEEEDGRIAHDGAAYGDALALAAGELLGLAIQQHADAQQVGGFLHLLVDLGFGRLAQLQAERHVIVHAHVRVERVALEHHGDVAILGGDIVDDAVADEDAAVADLLKAGEQAQAGGFAAAGRADEDEEFLVGDGDAQVVDGDDIAEPLENMFEGYTGHRVLCSCV